MRYGFIKGAWHASTVRRAALLVLVLLAPLATAQPAERDRAVEVREGADVDIYLSYSGAATSSRAGTRDGYTLSESRAHRVEWEGAMQTYRGAPGAPLSGSLTATWRATASHDHVWDYVREDGYHYHTEDHCAASDSEPFGFQAQITPEDRGLRVVLSGYAVPMVRADAACASSMFEKTWDGTTTDSSTSDFASNVALVHGLEESYYSRIEVLVPYDGVTSVPFEHRVAVPHDTDGPSRVYCQMPKGAKDWATGSCAGSGTLTVRSFVDPCPYIRRVYPEHHAALATVGPPSKEEAAVRAWSAAAGELVRQVLSDHRAWQLVGCAGDLEPDPWDAIHRVLKLQRDTLLELLREGKLSREGIGELLSAERALQLTGASDDSGATLGEIMAAGPPAPQGTVEVKVHSPVSLHAHAEDGGHVGWDAATNSSGSTIPGASYTGVPGGAQSIVLPSGFYKVVVEELDQGTYLLDVSMNGTGAQGEDVHLVGSRQGRTTSTHYAVTVGWDGPRLDAFPVRRGATTGEVAFVDAGRPSVKGAGETSGSEAETSGDGLEAGRDAPGAKVAVVLLALAAIALSMGRKTG